MCTRARARGLWPYLVRACCLSVHQSVVLLNQTFGGGTLFAMLFMRTHHLVSFVFFKLFKVYREHPNDKEVHIKFSAHVHRVNVRVAPQSFCHEFSGVYKTATTYRKNAHTPSYTISKPLPRNYNIYDDAYAFFAQYLPFASVHMCCFHIAGS